MPRKSSIRVEIWFELVKCQVRRSRKTGRYAFTEISQGFTGSRRDAYKLALLLRLGKKELEKKELNRLRYKRRGPTGFIVKERTVLTVGCGEDNGYRIGHLVEVTRKVKLPLWY